MRSVGYHEKMNGRTYFGGAALMSTTRQNGTAETTATRRDRNTRTTRAERTATQVSLDARLQEIMEGILERRVVDLDTLQLIASNQNWTKHPHLALVYFHCCDNHERGNKATPA